MKNWKGVAIKVVPGLNSIRFATPFAGIDQQNSEVQVNNDDTV